MMKSKANEADQESDLREAFKIFDKDKNGYIDMKELKQVELTEIIIYFVLKCFYNDNKRQKVSVL